MINHSMSVSTMSSTTPRLDNYHLWWSLTLSHSFPISTWATSSMMQMLSQATTLLKMTTYSLELTASKPQALKLQWAHSTPVASIAKVQDVKNNAQQKIGARRKEERYLAISALSVGHTRRLRTKDVSPTASSTKSSSTESVSAHLDTSDFWAAV